MCIVVFFFFFKQKTAYEMRISDWSSDVCSSDLAEDFANKEKIASLLRFASTSDASGEQSVSLTDYLSRMKEGQDKVYYLTGESYAQVKNSPHLEVFRKKGVEVLLLTDRIDEWLMSYLTEFDSRSEERRVGKACVGT